MRYKELGQQVEGLRAHLTPAFVEDTVRTLLRQGEDVGGGVNAMRLVKHLLGAPQLRDVEATWAYERLKKPLLLAVGQVPSLYFFEGD